MNPLLAVNGLAVDLLISGGLRPALDDVSFDIGAGEAVGLVGESGSGKSMTARAVARLLRLARCYTARCRFDDRDVSLLKGPALRVYAMRDRDDLPGPACPHQPGAVDRRLHDRSTANKP